MSEDNPKKIKIALMSYPMDNRKAKGTALYTRKLIEGLLEDPKFEYYLVHYEKVSDPVYGKAKEIIMPKFRFIVGSHFISQLLFFWKYRKENFDIVHWFQPRVYPFYSLVPAKKIIVTMHGAGDISAPHNFIFSRSIFNIVLKYFHRSIDMVVVVSEHAKNEVAEYYNFSKDKIISIYNGGGENYKIIEKAEAKKVVENKYNIHGSYILDISRFIPHKNVITLVNAYLEFRDRFPTHTEKLVVIGSSGDKENEVYRARNSSKFKEDIFFVDFVEGEDLNAFYSGAELFVFPSLSEGFGLPVLEAMASGVPVITSNIASMGEIGREAVIVTDPLNTVGLAEIMHSTLENPQKMAKMRESGLERAREFTWKKMIEKTEDLYRKIAA